MDLDLESEADANRALWTCVVLCSGLVAATFAVSVLTGNYSQTDKLWSLMPPIFAWIFALTGSPDARTLWMAFVASMWGARLTLNFNLHGGYTWPPWQGAEDYRWAHVRQLTPLFEVPAIWYGFVLVFVCGFCNAILLAQVLPCYVAVAFRGSKPMDLVDWALGGLVLALVVVEAAADAQQQAFQRRKAALPPSRRTGEEKDGFVQSGLWAVCRKPNYACEQAIWIVFYGFAARLLGSDSLWHWSGLGAVLVLALFTPSTIFSESISAKKYPKYAAWQKSTCMFLPLGPLLSSN